METEDLWRATKQKCVNQFELVRSMRVREKRHVFFILRQCEELTSDTFLPGYGLHCGEFACFQLLAQSSRKDEGSTAAEAAVARRGEAARVEGAPREFAACAEKAFASRAEKALASRAPL